MYQGNWKCSLCGGAITELPFQPRSESGLTCRTCYFKDKEATKNEVSAGEIPVAAEPMPTDDVPDFDESQISTEPAPAEDALAGLETTAPIAAGDKPRFEGEWQCAICNKPITSLPFQPRSTEHLKCLDCFKASKS